MLQAYHTHAYGCVSYVGRRNYTPRHIGGGLLLAFGMAHVDPDWTDAFNHQRDKACQGESLPKNLAMAEREAARMRSSLCRRRASTRVPGAFASAALAALTGSTRLAATSGKASTSASSRVR